MNLWRFLRLWRTRSKRRKQHTSLRGTKQAMFVSFPRFVSSRNETIDIILMVRGDTNHGEKIMQIRFAFYHKMRELGGIKYNARSARPRQRGSWVFLTSLQIVS